MTVGAVKHIDSILAAMQANAGFTLTPKAMETLRAEIVADRAADQREIARLAACEEQITEVIEFLNDKKVPAGPLLYRLSVALEGKVWS